MAAEAIPLILIVDDDRDLRALLDANLSKAGYRTLQAATGAEAIAQAATARPDIVLLDHGLPDVSGAEVCRLLKSNADTSSIRIVMLTGHSNEEARVLGFELGVEDYIAKPFSLRELILRLGVVRRRWQAAARKPTGLLRAGRISVDADSYVARVDGVVVSLAAVEFRLLLFLVEGEGRPRTRPELMRDVWGYSAYSDSRTLDTHIKRLRRKLGDAGEQIETVRTVGYRILMDGVGIPEKKADRRTRRHDARTVQRDRAAHGAQRQ
jgi:two-component system phosphate regulon response regulator PhoB